MECQVCLEHKLLDEFPQRNPTETCSHAVACCITCLSQTITAAFEGRMWYDIRCPICNNELKHEDVAEFATQDIFQKYDNLATRRALASQLPNFRWCPGPKCEYGEEHPDDPKHPMTTCTSCGFNSCFYHETPWHEGITCDEYNAKITVGAVKAEKKSEKVIRKIAKRCPGCQRYINKNGGCSHMSCKSIVIAQDTESIMLTICKGPCGNHFCWSCLHDYPGHAWTCKERI
ncbi:hypothetical protein BGZ57DRAFT_778783 [Hyaloscypha finlandica]|nr:hypothetical protein BGZ57DRAFT_778783 [Hyaloscypha finlandica]